MMKNKFHKVIVFSWILVGSLFLNSCEKDNSNGNILVTVKYNGKAVPQATVYIKYGTLSNPNIPLSQYDKVSGADAIGQVYFENLPPNKYFIYATGYSGSTVKGESSTTVIERSRQNENDITVNTN